MLTFPPLLHRYHRDGFPYLIAFRDGQQILGKPLCPYDLVFESLRREFWPGQEIPLVLTSPSHIGTPNCLEAATVWVVPDGDEDGHRRLGQTAERINKSLRPERFIDRTVHRLEVRHESELTEADLCKHLAFEGASGGFMFRTLDGQPAPLRITSENIEIGPHSFAKKDVGLSAWFPNPRNPERYVSLLIKGANVARSYRENWVDFVVYRDGADGNAPTVLLRGLFDDSDAKAWRYSEKLAQGGGEPKCKAGACPAPTQVQATPCCRSGSARRASASARGSASRWLPTRCHCLDALRRRGRRRDAHVLPADSHTADSRTGALTRLVRQEPRARIMQLVQALPADQREALYLRYADSLSRGEIAYVLDLPESVVKSRLFEGLEKLREHTSLLDNP